MIVDLQAQRARAPERPGDELLAQARELAMQWRNGGAVATRR
jgi:hypothetical protein